MAKQKIDLFWWKLYFWIMLVLTILGVIISIPEVSKFNLGDWRGLFETGVILLGTYSYVFAKKIFGKNIWMYLFWYLIVFWTLDLLFISVLKSQFSQLSFLFGSSQVSDTGLAFSVLLGMPALIAIYRLSFDKG